MPLIIDIEERDIFDERTGSFTVLKPTTVKLEHSLISLAKWESIYERPFLSQSEKDKRGPEDVRNYIRCMVIGSCSDIVYDVLISEYMSYINDYINAPNTATTINRRGTGGPPSRTFVTSELIYYWMIRFSIPFETQRWHLNRLLTLIDICNIKEGGKKMPVNDVYRRNKELNEARRAALKSKG